MPQGRRRSSESVGGYDYRVLVEDYCPSCGTPQHLDHQDDCNNTNNGSGNNKWWRKYLLLGSVLTLILIVGIGMILIMKGNHDHDETEENKPVGKCETEGCQKAAKGLKSSMNLRVDPCEDFYEYVCGAYPVDEGDNSTSTFSLMQKQNWQLIQEYLDDPSQFPPVEGKGVKLAHNFYQSCIHQHNTLSDDNFHLENLISLNTGITEQGQSIALLCTKWTLAFFPDVTSRIFLSRTSYDSEKQRGILRMMDEVLDTYKSLIGRISWLDPSSKDDVILWKLERTKRVAGYPQGLFTKLEEMEEERYGSLEISKEGSDYAGNLRKLYGRWNNTVLLLPPEEDVLISEVPNSNAFYLGSNLIFVPAGISQDPFYDPGYPDILNYARLGTILGHEFTHAFQANFDLDDPYLISPDLYYGDEFNMRERVKCVKDQYGRFQLPDDLLNNWRRNSSVTWKEDLADILGFQVGFELTKKIWEERETYQVLPRLEMFSPEQIFFIAAAQTECRSFKNAEVKRDVLEKEIVDDHSPKPIRILGGMSNNDEFAKAFNCPLGSRYNPVNKCRFFD